MQIMTRTRWIALTWILLCCGLSALWGFSMMRNSPNLMLDFKAVYYSTRCLLQHHDPYNVSELDDVYRAEGGERPAETIMAHQAVTININLPTTFICIAPLAMLPWGTAQVLWTFLGIGGLIFAAFLAWDLGADYAPVISCCLICFVLANTEIFFPIGNTAEIVVSLCAVAVWCFLKDRLVWAGALCLAISLAMKPQDAGLVWLYFLLAGGLNRKRALQTLLVTAILGLAAIVWVTPIAPHWMQERHSNFILTSARGGGNDPGPTSGNGGGTRLIIDLQSALAIFLDDPRVYNSVSYLVCGTLLLIWAVRTLRVRFSPARAWLALATVVPITMLVTYHRVHDSKLLLLAIPACAMLWAGGGLIRWLALLLTFAAIVFTGDISLTVFDILTKNLHISTAELSGRLMTVLVTRPTQLALLAMGMFYLGIYLRREPERG
jgi:hypothetical protein